MAPISVEGRRRDGRLLVGELILSAVEVVVPTGRISPPETADRDPTRGRRKRVEESCAGAGTGEHHRPSFSGEASGRTSSAPAKVLAETRTGAPSLDRADRTVVPCDEVTVGQTCPPSVGTRMRRAPTSIERTADVIRSAGIDSGLRRPSSVCVRGRRLDCARRGEERRAATRAAFCVVAVTGNAE